MPILEILFGVVINFCHGGSFTGIIKSCSCGDIWFSGAISFTFGMINWVLDLWYSILKSCCNKVQNSLGLAKILFFNRKNVPQAL